MSFNQHRLRIGRYSEVGRCYHVTTAVHDRTSLFTDWQLARPVVAALKHQQDQRNVYSIAWLLMPDHLHWLFELKQGDISSMVRRVKGCSAQAINQARGSTRPVWQRGFHDRAIRRDEDLKQVARYILRNPLEAGLVKRIGDYPLWDACWI